jgi:putative phosphoesterase
LSAERSVRHLGAGSSGSMRVGLISDTHGWLDPRVAEAFRLEAPLAGIVHAGDIGADDVLYQLHEIAHVTAVLGNCDYQLPGFELGTIARVTLGGIGIVVVHDIHDLPPDARDEIVVHGHSHRPRVERRQGVLFLNPGSATQRRHQPSCSVGVLEIAADGGAGGRIIYLDELGPRSR